MEEPAGFFRRNLLEKLSRSSLSVAARPEVHGQKWGTFRRKNPPFLKAQTCTLNNPISFFPSGDVK